MSYVSVRQFPVLYSHFTSSSVSWFLSQKSERCSNGFFEIQFLSRSCVLFCFGRTQDTKNEFDVKRDECAAVVREIMDACEESGKKFFEPSFLFSNPWVDLFVYDPLSKNRSMLTLNVQVKISHIFLATYSCLPSFLSGVYANRSLHLLAKQKQMPNLLHALHGGLQPTTI